MKGDMTYMNEDPKEHPLGPLQWNIDNLVTAINQVYTNKDWALEPIKFLDVDVDAREEYYFNSQESFDTFMMFWDKLKQNKPFPVDTWFEKAWKNKRAQVTCLEYLIHYSYNNTDVQFEKAKRRQEPIANLQANKSTSINYMRIWKCVDLVQTLVILSESEYYNRVRSLFDAPIKTMPEYLLLTLTKIKTKAGKFIIEDLYSYLLPTFLTGHANSIPVLSEIWTTDMNLIINSMAELYHRNPKNMNLSRVLDISQSLKNSLLDIITNCKDYEFSLPLGLLGAKRDFLHFENWIVMLIKNEGDPLVRCLLKYLDQNLIQPCEEVKEDKKKVDKILERSQLSEEKLSMIYENLLQIQEKQPELLEYDTRRLYSQSLSKIVQLFPSVHTEQNNNEEIEEKANEYFQQLYREEKEVDDLVKTMKDFRSSSNRTEREIYACMVQNLFDEWKFFPKYPKKELSMTAKLFGKIISEKKIIDGVVTDIGLKCIVEGLKREGKMFDFAITALEECKDSIEHETGLKNILTCKQLHEKKPELYEYITRRYKELHGVQEQQPPPKVEPKTPGIENFRPPIIGGPDPSMPVEMSSNPMTPGPDPRMVEGGFHPVMGRQPKPLPKPNPLVNTPTQPGKYFTEQNQMTGWKNTPNQKTPGARMIYPNTTGQQRSARPVVENFNLGPPAEGLGSSLAPRALNLQSKDFKPKTQQVQEYLKKDELNNPPGDFMDTLITTLNMTGTDQVRRNAEKLEEEIKEEYVPAIAHYMVVRRVIESDEKRIDFFSNFFHSMRNRVIIKSLRDECIEVILRIIINESVDPNSKNEVTRQASTPIKNVACFLGYLTLVHNQPLLSTDFNLKQLLLEGHEKKCMSIVIMVVCKILRTGEKSRVFTPYNPWMVGLYSMLVEYLNYYVDNSPDFDKNIPKEIQLVLRNRRGDIGQSKESTLFRDFDAKNANNKELLFLNNRMLNDPLINIPKMPMMMSTSPNAEEGKEESSSGNLYDNTFNQDMVIISESSQKFPGIDTDYLKTLTNQGINQAMREIIEAVIRRVIPIASITTRTLVLKDFALEPDAERLRQASISTAKSLAGMLAQITCKDILKYQFIKSLKDLVYQSKEPSMSSLSDDQKRELIETITKENSEIGCNKIIAAVQMEALNNISKDDSISTAINKRIQFQADGTDFRDLTNIENFNKLPPILKPLETGLTDEEFQVYQDFDNIASIEQQIEDDANRLLEDEVPLREPEEAKMTYPHTTHDQKAIIERFLGICTSFVSNELKVIDFASTFQKELSELRVIMEKNKNSQDILTEFFLSQTAIIALNANLLVSMIECQILSVSGWQKRFAFHLRQSIESINDVETMEFLEQFIIRSVLDKGIIKESHIPDLIGCIEMFSKTKKNDNATRWKLMLALFETTDPTSPVFEDLASLYFKTWVNTRNHEVIRHRFSYKIGVVFKLSQHMEMFIKNALNESLVIADRSNENYNIGIIDVFSMMIISSSFNWVSQPGEKLINVMDESQVLEIIFEVMDTWHNEKLTQFDQAPFKRLITRFLIHFSHNFKDNEYNDMEKLQKKSELLIMFSNLFKKMTPSRYPAFAFAWLELISSQHFMPQLLNTTSDYNTTERLFKCQELFIELFAFLKQNIYENSPTTPSLEKFFEGTLKLILVVLHDYPEFLCHNYFQFINHLPLYKTGNLRNMILAAYPRNMRLPDPHAEIVKFESSIEPYGLDRQTLLQHYTHGQVFTELKEVLDLYIQTHSEDTLKDVCDILEETQVVKSHRRIINTGIVHAAMLYLASDIEGKNTVQELSDPTLATKYELMCENLSTPVRDILLNAMFNELRLLNKSTVFFMDVLLQIFRNADSKESITSSQIARILVGRMRLPKIHPWGLLAFKARIGKEPKFIAMNITQQQQ